MPTTFEIPLVKRYGDFTIEKGEGVTYTPPRLADFVAAQIARCAILPTGEIHVLDPAVGDGELLLSLLEQLVARTNARIVVHGFDVSAAAVSQAHARIEGAFPDAIVRLEVGNFLEFALDNDRNTHALLRLPISQPERLFDLIIANPPYVRTQIMGAKQAQKLGAAFGLSGRVDLYHAFLMAISGVLRPTGTAGLIVSNRFMTTRGGACLRAALRTQLRLRQIWDLGDTKIFDAAVLPAVILAQGRQCKEHYGDDEAAAFTSIYQTTEAATLEAADPVAALKMAGTVVLKDGRRFRVQQGTLDEGSAEDEVWRIATDASDAWLATVERHTCQTFGDVAKIRVGVKTCADKIFIRADWDKLPKGERPELLSDLTTHHIARRFRAAHVTKQRQIVYPHQSIDGQRQAVDLKRFPRTRAYLESHRAALESRSYVIEGGRQWYELWVPQDPAAWDAPKLVFRDISERPTFWIDLDGTIVNGDCYWMTLAAHQSQDLLWLAAAVANSRFIEAFYDARFNNKLYAGRRRFMTQYVEKFPLPDPQTPLSRDIIALCKDIHAQPDQGSTEEAQIQLEAMVWEAFGLEAPA